MKKYTQIVVITRNIWLFKGIKALEPNLNCSIMRLEEVDLPEELNCSVRTLVLIDSAVLLSGISYTFSTLLEKIPQVEVVWMANNLTGNLFPSGREATWILKQTESVSMFLTGLKNILCASNLSSKLDSHVTLTKTECFLLNYFFSELPMKRIARITNKSVKTLYLHRRNILLKTGFRQLCFLKLAYKNGCELRGMGLRTD